MARCRRMRGPRVSVRGWLAAVLLLVGCRSAPAALPPPPTLPPTPALTTVTIGVAQSAAAIVTLTPPDALPDVRVRWVETSAAVLAGELAAGNIDAMIVHIPPAGDALYVNPVAVDALVLIVHPDNPLRSISPGEAQALFSGQIERWDVLGGAALPVLPVIRERGAGVRDLFDQRVLGAQRPAIGALVAVDPVAVRRAVAAEPGAIGYVTLASLPPGTTDPSLAVRQLAIDGSGANPASAAAQSYPLSVPLYWVSREEPTGALRALLAYWQSPAGQTVLGARLGRVVP